MLEGRPVACSKCKCHCVGVYYASTTSPHYHMCLKCYSDTGAAADQPGGGFDRVVPRSAAAQRAWSDTSDFISTRNSFSSLDEEELAAGGAGQGQAGLLQQHQQHLTLQQQQLALLAHQQQLLQQGVEAARAMHEACGGKMPAAAAAALAPLTPPPGQQPTTAAACAAAGLPMTAEVLCQQLLLELQHLPEVADEAEVQLVAADMAAHAAQWISTGQASAAELDQCIQQLTSNAKAAMAGGAPAAGAGGLPDGSAAAGGSGDQPPLTWRDWIPKKLMQWNSMLGQAKGEGGEGQGAGEGLSRKRNAAVLLEDSEDDVYPASADFQDAYEGSSSPGQGAGAGHPQQASAEASAAPAALPPRPPPTLSDLQLAHLELELDSISDDGGAGEEQAGGQQAQPPPEAVRQLIDDIMRRVREMYATDPETADLSLGSITHFVVRKLPRSVLNELRGGVLPADRARLLQEFYADPSVVYQTPEHLQAAMTLLSYRELQILLAYTARQHADAMALQVGAVLAGVL